jgi:PhnB protein
MTTINIYLTFNGDCEAAFKFYKSAFGGEFLTMSRFKEMPPDPNFPVDEADMEKIMHVTLPISKETVLMGSDTGGEWAAHFKQGNNFSVSIGTDSKEEADRLFYILSEDGKVTMPMSDTFWESYFGMFTDKFGIQWMVSFDDPNREK